MPCPYDLLTQLVTLYKTCCVGAILRTAPSCIDRLVSVTPTEPDPRLCLPSPC